MKRLRVSPDLTMPDDAVTQTFLLLGKRGSGKTNTAVVLAEEMHRAGGPFVVLDPIGAWWGIKASFDGKGVGLPVYVFGGDHGDLPLQSTKGELMAQVFIDHRASMVLDMKGWSGRERAHFVTDFALWLLGHNDRQPVHVFLEEADAFIPQKPYKGEEAMLGAMDRLIRWGRQEGIGSTTISQRSARINKDVTTQTEVLIAHRTTGPQDRDVIRDWIRYHAGGEEQQTILGTLPTLADGTAWVWSPEWLGILKEVHFRRRETYDSASTPKLGERRVQPKALAPVDLEKLRGQLAETIEKAKADDPKELRRRIAELERSLKDLHAAPGRVVEKVVEKPVPYLDESLREKLQATVKEMRSAIQLLDHLARSIDSDVQSYVISNPPPSRKVPDAKPQTSFERMSRQPSEGIVHEWPPIEPLASGSPKLGKGERTVLEVLRQYPAGRTYNELAFLAGYSANASTLGVILARLRRLGLIGSGNQPVALTDAGVEAAGGTEEMPTGQALLDRWLQHPRMGKGERDVLRTLIEQYPRDLTNDELCELTGYSPAASTIGVILSRLRKLGLVEKGARRLAPEFAAAIERTE